MPHCRLCGREIADEDRFCSACGAVAHGVARDAADDVATGAAGGAAASGGAASDESAGAAAPSGLSIGGHFATIVGCLGMIIGPFLPWATSILFWVTGIEYSDYRAMVFVMLGVFGMIAAVAALARRRTMPPWVPIPIGLVGLGLSIYYIVDLHSRLPHLVQRILEAWAGAGIFVCTAGSVVVLIGGVMIARARD